MPASKGNTTYDTVLHAKASHGTVTSVTPSGNAAIGANAKTMTTSFTDTDTDTDTDTCTSEQRAASSEQRAARPYRLCHSISPCLY